MYPQVPSSLSHLKFKRIDYRNCYYYEDDNILILKSYNTIVALSIKKNGYVFIDEYKYSSYTGQHIGVFTYSIMKEHINKVFQISQQHLIKIILEALNGKEIKLDIRNKFNTGDYVKTYRLHGGMRDQVVKIKKPSYMYAYAFRVDKDCKDTYLTPQSYNVEITNHTKYNWTTYIKLRNLKPLEGGI